MLQLPPIHQHPGLGCALCKEAERCHAGVSDAAHRVPLQGHHCQDRMAPHTVKYQVPPTLEGLRLQQSRGEAAGGVQGDTLGLLLTCHGVFSRLLSAWGSCPNVII